MHLLNWVDYRTLAAGQLPLAAVFAIVLFGIWRVYPHLRGTDTMALGFSLWIPSAALAVAAHSIPLFASSIFGNLISIFGYILLYRGLLSFLQIKGNLPVLYDVAAVASAVIIYFTTVYDLSLPRIIAISAVVAVARGLMAIELFWECKGPFAPAAVRDLSFAVLRFCRWAWLRRPFRQRCFRLELQRRLPGL